MKKGFPKNSSLLGIILMVASVVAAAMVPDKSNGRRANNGTLRAFSATAFGGDQDAPQAIISCIPEIETIMSCTAATKTCTTTGGSPNSCCSEVGGGLEYQTEGNTSQTNYNDSVDDNSVHVHC